MSEDHVCEKFLKRLCHRIEKRLKENATLREFADDMQIGHTYKGGHGQSRICLYWDCGARYEVEQSDSDQRNFYSTGVWRERAEWLVHWRIVSYVRG